MRIFLVRVKDRLHPIENYKMLANHYRLRTIALLLIFITFKAPNSFMQLHLKKSLGQHFLKDDQICRNIVAKLLELPFERLLEVGPGGGALTKLLVNIANIDFKAVEVDDEKVAFLQQQYPQLKGKIIHESILDILPPFDQPFTVIGNFPYNISSQILFKILDWHPQVQAMIGMFQKEVAERVAAPPGSKVYGVISVLIQAYFSVSYLFDVPPSAFQPPPKVMSGVICLVPRGIENPTPAMRSEKHFKLLVKTAFNQRRKQLRNGVRGLFPPATLTHPIFDRRAEQLSVAEFAELTFTMQ